MNPGASGAAGTPPLRLVFGGDLMLGRMVRDAMLHHGSDYPLAGVAPLLRDADLAIANLECALTDRAERWPGNSKTYYFAGPAQAGEALSQAGIGLVSVANNHVLDYGAAGLRDTLAALDAHGIAHAGAGPDLAAALAPAIVERRGARIGMAAFCDHQADFAATDQRPGIAWLDPDDEPAALDALERALAPLRAAGVAWTILSLHWGPNMVHEPAPRRRRLARAAVGMGWNIVFGHSAHVFHGIELVRGCPVLYAAGDLVDDYRVDPAFRNDHQLLFGLELQGSRLARIVLQALHIRHGRVAPADPARRAWAFARMRALCGDLGTEARYDGERLMIEPKPEPDP